MSQEQDMLILGIDLGGTKILTAVIDENGAISAAPDRQVATRAAQDVQAGLDGLDLELRLRGRRLRRFRLSLAPRRPRQSQASDHDRQGYSRDRRYLLEHFDCSPRRKPLTV